MANFEDLSANANLNGRELARLREMISEWQLLADLSFADLLLWVPIRESAQSWPEGHILIAQMRPTTAATIFPKDLIATQLSWGENPLVDAALSDGEIQRDSEPEPYGDLMVKEETIPILYQGRVIGVISRSRNIEQMRSPGRLELAYREAAFDLARMIAEGTFPINVATKVTPRVGDGLIRLDRNGMVSFSSPNAISAFRRMGLKGDLDLQDLSALIEKLSNENNPRLAQHESWRAFINSQSPEYRELENEDGILELYMLPLSAGGDRVGALLLVHNVTEIRRRERELISKDATIREIHHRVKNNLQTVSALLRLQSRRAENSEAVAAIEEAIRRIGSIAVVHEMLSTSLQETVEFDAIAQRLVAAIKDLTSPSTEITINRAGAFGELRPEVATPLALILTELLQNAFEHGITKIGSIISIEVLREGNHLTLEVSDDGVGLPENFELNRSETLGLQIVKTLTTNELGGTIEMSNNKSGGAKVRIDFYC